MVSTVWRWCGGGGGADAGEASATRWCRLPFEATNRTARSLFVVFVGYGPVTEEFKLLSRLHYTKFIRHRKGFCACFETAMIKVMEVDSIQLVIFRWIDE